MIKIGLVGEAPNDTEAIKNLLSKKYTGTKFEYFLMIINVGGSELDNQKSKRVLRIEFEVEKPDIVIFIRDLDGLENDKSKLKSRKNYYIQSNSIVNKKGIFLLHIYEAEALIFTDIEAFNKANNTNYIFTGNPMDIVKPKEELLKIDSKYKESDMAKIYKNIDFEKVLSCKYFKNFIDESENIVRNI